MHQTNHRKPAMAMFVATFAILMTVLFQNCSAQKSVAFTSTSELASQATAAAVGVDSAQSINLLYSASLNGIPQSTFAVNQVMYGKVAGLGAQNIASCTEILGSNSCARNDQFTNMPANGWTFDGDYWRTTISIIPDYVGKSFRSYWLDKATGHKSLAVDFKVVAASTPVPTTSCSWHPSTTESVIGPCTGHTVACTASTINMNESITCGGGKIINEFCDCR